MEKLHLFQHHKLKKNIVKPVLHFSLSLTSKLKELSIIIIIIKKKYS